MVILLTSYSTYLFFTYFMVRKLFPIHRQDNDEMEFVIEANLSRRHLNSFQKAEIGLKLLEIEKEKAKKRMLAGKHPVPSEGTGRSIEIVADKLHISKNTVEKVKEIIEKGDEELIEKCRQGEVSVLEAYKKIKNEEKELDDSR